MPLDIALSLVVIAAMLLFGYFECRDKWWKVQRDMKYWPDDIRKFYQHLRNLVKKRK